MTYKFVRIFSIAVLTVTIITHCKGGSLNVGTTLFSESDVYKQCWSSEHISILTTRMVLEDLLPAKNCLVIENNDFVNDIIQYFRLILEVIRKHTRGKTKHISLMALTDLLGGYLNHAVLPMAKFSYYAGVIDYMSVEKLLQLFDELKWFLRTNGQGWAPPIPEDPFGTDAERIVVQPPLKGMKPCNGLTVFENLKTAKASDPHACNAMVIPLPFFDSRNKPCSIAVPFKAYPLRNMESKCAAYVVLKYYIAGYKCLLSKKAGSDSMKIFNNNLYTWIMKEVVPKLNDEKFYSAFGGILRVLVTLKRAGAREVDLSKVIQSINRLSGNRTDVIEELPPGKTKGAAASAVGDEQHLSKKAIILMAMLITICVWFLIGTVYICYRMRSAKGYDGKSRSSKSTTPSASSGSSKSPFKQGVTSYACHSSLTGDYAMEEKRGNSPYVFAYDDFETSTDEETSRATDTEGKSGMSK